MSDKMPPLERLAMLAGIASEVVADRPKRANRSSYTFTMAEIIEIQKAVSKLSDYRTKWLDACSENQKLLDKLHTVERERDDYKDRFRVDCELIKEYESRLGAVREALEKHKWDKGMYWLEQTLKPILAPAVEGPGQKLRRVLDDPEAMERVAERASEAQNRIVEAQRPDFCEAGPKGKCTHPDCLCEVHGKPIDVEKQGPQVRLPVDLVWPMGEWESTGKSIEDVKAEIDDSDVESQCPAEIFGWPCVLPKGHSGKHRDANGVRFAADPESQCQKPVKGKVGEEIDLTAQGVQAGDIFVVDSEIHGRCPGCGVNKGNLHKDDCSVLAENFDKLATDS